MSFVATADWYLQLQLYLLHEINGFLSPNTAAMPQRRYCCCCYHCK
jgi:hypothetical protein